MATAKHVQATKARRLFKDSDRGGARHDSWTRSSCRAWTKVREHCVVPPATRLRYASNSCEPLSEDRCTASASRPVHPRRDAWVEPIRETPIPIARRSFLL